MWKLIWQILFIFSIIMFVIMFLKFTVSGFKDIKELLKVNSKSLFNIIKIWSKKNNLSVDIDYVNENKKLNGYFTIFKSVVFYLFLFFFIKNFAKKTMIENNNDNVLIDTFATKESILGERLYRGLDKFLNKKKINNVFFVPTFIIERNLINTIKIIFQYMI